jgi:NADPH:quinone reductase
MRAVVVDPPNRLGFDFAEVDEPELADDPVLVAIEKIALNRGDLIDARSGRLIEA